MLTEFGAQELVCCAGTLELALRTSIAFACYEQRLQAQQSHTQTNDERNVLEVADVVEQRLYAEAQTHERISEQR